MLGSGVRKGLPTLLSFPESPQSSLGTSNYGTSGEWIEIPSAENRLLEEKQLLEAVVPKLKGEFCSSVLLLLYGCDADCCPRVGIYLFPASFESRFRKMDDAVIRCVQQPLRSFALGGNTVERKLAKLIEWLCLLVTTLSTIELGCAMPCVL